MLSKGGPSAACLMRLPPKGVANRGLSVRFCRVSGMSNEL